MTQTLGDYFRELRESARRFPVVDRAGLEAMSDADIAAALAIRHWGKPSGAAQGKRSTREAWIRHFLKQQVGQRCPTFRDVAKRAGLDGAAVWKIEHDRGVRGDTLRRALVDGLGFAPDGPEVHRALALLTARSGAGKLTAATLKTDIAEVENRQTFNQFLERAVPVLATIPPREYDAVLEALSNPATVESLAALNKLAATAGKPKLRVVPKPKG